MHAWCVQEGSLPKIGVRDWPYMAFLGLVGVALPQTLIFVGNQLSGPNVIAIMQPAGPVRRTKAELVSRTEGREDEARLMAGWMDGCLSGGQVYAAVFAVALKLEKLTALKAAGTLLNVCGALGEGGRGAAALVHGGGQQSRQRWI